MVVSLFGCGHRKSILKVRGERRYCWIAVGRRRHASLTAQAKGTSGEGSDWGRRMSSQAWGMVTGQTGDTGQWPKLGLAASLAAAHTGEESGTAAQKGRRKIDDEIRKKRARMKAEVEEAAGMRRRSTAGVMHHDTEHGAHSSC